MTHDIPLDPLEFDWNQSEFAMIGKPIIKNFPSKLVSVLKNGTCTTTVSGAFEHATIVELRNDPALGMSNAVHAEAPNSDREFAP